MYKCTGVRQCVPMSERCDGSFQCPHGDDELFCNLHCPDNCSCNTLSYFCQDAGLFQVPEGISHQARLLNLSGNQLHIENITFLSYQFLIELYISHNDISGIPKDVFSSIGNLNVLDLSFNQIYTLADRSFEGLRSLKKLNLVGNHLSLITDGAFKGLTSLPRLILKNMHITEISKGMLLGLNSVKVLDISGNKIRKLEANAFTPLKSVTNLNISYNEISLFSKADFSNLVSLKTMESDDYMFCCFVNIREEDCLPQPDELSSCTDLMKNYILKIFLWIIGGVSLVGNMFVLIWRGKDNHGLAGSLIMNLATGDLLMGIYMIVIASVDSYYSGRYIENSQAWRTSWLCQLMGCVAVIASESSVMCLLVMTLDRFVNIVFPFSSFKLSITAVRILMGIIWSIIIFIATVPLFGTSYFHGTFYSRSGVCVSIHITNQKTPGWEYSVSIFHGLNFIVFFVIFITYIYMFNFMKATSQSVGRRNRLRELTVARKMALIIITDFCCWIPINVMGKSSLFMKFILVYTVSMIFVNVRYNEISTAPLNNRKLHMKVH